jgi:FKBP-type peptidyl-prolyl cis-trans isomerase
MKKLSSYLFIPLIMVLVASCSQGYHKTKSGLLYKIISDGKGQAVKKGDFLKFDFVQKVHDSVLRTNYGSVPAYSVVDSVKPTYDPTEIFINLHKGDSAVVVIMVDTLVRKFGGQLPPFLKKHDKIFLSLKVSDVFTSKDAVDKDREAERQKEVAKDDKAVSDFLATNKINASKTAKGTYVVVQNQGDGPAADSGKQVCLFYTGKSMFTGKVFESNITGPRKDTLKFVVGRKGMIPGMDDGIRLFKKGGKGILYIPGVLAYDAQNGPTGKPYEDLIFEINVVDVTEAPKEVARNPAQTLSPQQLQALKDRMQKNPNGK